MLVHVKIAFCPQSKIEGAMACNKFEHVVKKTNAARDFGGAAAIQAEPNANVRLVRGAPERSAAGNGPAVCKPGAGHQRFPCHLPRMAARSLRISAVVPMVMRDRKSTRLNSS